MKLIVATAVVTGQAVQDLTKEELLAAQKRAVV